MLTRKSKYGLKALLRMARDPERAMLASEIADAERIPKKYLQLILLDLKRRGMVKSRRGKNGGYQLARPPSEIHIGAVMRGLEGPLALTPCASETAYHRCDETQLEQADDPLPELAEADHDRAGLRILQRDEVFRRDRRRPRLGAKVFLIGLGKLRGSRA